jgi:hypothetical protein
MSLDKDPALSELYRTFISGCHILHNQGYVAERGRLNEERGRSFKSVV